MPITISGSTGIAGVDGSASTPAVQGTDTTTGIVFPAADTVTVATGGTERMRIDSSGNVGIGTASPLTAANFKSVTLQGGSVGCAYSLYNSSGVESGRFQIDTNQVALYNLTASLPMTFYTNSTERARIDSSGNLLVGTTTARAKLTVKSTSDVYTSGGINLERASSTNRWGILTASTNDLYFGYNEVDKGYISNSTGAYTSVSDATLKKNIVDITFGLEAIKGLRPVEYLMVDEAEGQQKHLGFLAQEVQQVLPSSISIMRSGKLGMDKSEIIPVLVKAIQELKADNDAMKERIAALEAK